MASVLGSAGVLLLLTAYVLRALEVVGPGYAYYGLNLVGAALAAIGSALLNFVPFIVLESVWAGVAAVELTRLRRSRSGPGPEPSLGMAQ